MIYSNNFSEIHELRDIEEAIMDVISRARDIMTRTAAQGELRRAFLEINEKQKTYEAKLDDILRLHNARHEEFQACFVRCRQLIGDLEEAEDRIQQETFRILERSAEDADAIRTLGAATNRNLGSWIQRNLQGLKELFSREQVR